MIWLFKLRQYQQFALQSAHGINLVWIERVLAECIHQRQEITSGTGSSKVVFGHGMTTFYLRDDLVIVDSHHAVKRRAQLSGDSISL